MTDQLRKRNHWVPASYLAPFTTDGRRESPLIVYPREDPGEPFPAPPDAIAKEKYLYVVRIDGRAPDDSLERMFAEHVEPPFGRIRNKLVWGPSHGIRRHLSVRESRELALFLAFQQMRTQAARDTLQWLDSFHATLMTRSRLQNPGAAQEKYKAETGEEISEETLVEWRDELDRGELMIKPHENRWLGVAMESALEAAEVIHELDLRVVDAPPGITLPTCDDPLVVVRRDFPSGNYHLGGGWRENDVEATLTLSPDCVLVLSRSPDVFLDIGTETWFHDVVERTIKHAQRWVFSSQEDPAITETLAASDRPAPVVEFGDRQYSTRGDPNEAVRDLIEDHPGEALLRFGPRR